MKSVVSVTAPEAQRYLRRRLFNYALAITAATAGLVLIGGLLWAFADRNTFWFKLGLILTVGTTIRLAFDLSRLWDEWLRTPTFHAGRLAIFRDRVVRVESGGRSLEWRLDDIRQVRLREFKYAQGTRRIMTVRLGRLRNFDVVVPSSVSFDYISETLGRLNVPVSRPAT